MSGSQEVAIGALIIFALLLIYVVGGSYMEHKHCPFGHETGVMLILGLMISAIMWAMGVNLSHDFQFNGSIFFYVCLPPIIFASGYNMRRKRFFDNIGYILLFGIFGTLLTFTAFSGLTFAAFELKWIYQYQDGVSEVLEFSVLQCMLISSLLCSSDVIAAISIIKYEEQPKLFSLVFGEGIVNDAVAIILFNTVTEFNDGSTVFSWKTPFAILGNFFVLGIASIGIGLVIGLIASYLLKKMRFITISSIKETLFIFSSGYLAYALGEMIHMSGIIALLTSGVVMAHYGWYNLSPQGKTVSSVAIQVIGFGFEAFVFAYLGLSYFSYIDYPWSWQFILVESFITILARFFGTVGLVYFMVLCTHKKQVTFKQLLFISYSGLIRGAIAFGLVLKIEDPHKEVVVTTALTLVIGTTILFGSFMPLVQKLLVPPIEEEKHEYDSQDAEGTEDGKDNKNNETGQFKKINSSDDEDHHEEFLHPNALRESTSLSQMEQNKQLTRSQFVKHRKKKLNSCKSCCKRFDDLIMRPILIHNYDEELIKKKDEFQELFMKEGELWEKIYMTEEKDLDEYRKERGMSLRQHIGSIFQKTTIHKASMNPGSFASNKFGSQQLRLSTLDKQSKSPYQSSRMTNGKPVLGQKQETKHEKRSTSHFSGGNDIHIVQEETAEFDLSNDKKQ